MEKLHFTAEELAERWCMETTTLANWRNLGKGPRHIKMGGKKVLYPIVEIEDFEKQNVVNTSQAPGPAAGSRPTKPESESDSLDGWNLTPDQLAERWHLAKTTLSNWRVSGEGPRYAKFGRKVIYPIAEIEAFERKNLRAAVSVPAKE